MPKQRPIIVIDPGHGGTEKIGGSSPNNAVGANGLLEKDLTLDIAQRTAAVLQDGVNVVLTRNADANLSLAERASMARQNNAALFLSLHFNGSQDKTRDGAETFVARKANQQSEILAQNILQTLGKVIGGSSRIRFADLGVIKPERHAPNTASCLAEIAFLTNLQQAKRLEEPTYRQHLAIALSDAILKSLPMIRSQSLSAAAEGDLDAGYFQPLNYYALGGEPVANIKKSVGKKGDNREEDVLAVKKRLIELGFEWIKPDKNVDAGTIEAIVLFQSIVSNSRKLSGDGTIEVGKNSHRWLQAVNAPRWEKMPKGSAAEGFENYEYDSEKIHFYGTNWMAETLIGASAHYRDNYLKSNPTATLLKVNDVSLVRGGKAPPHTGHQTGLDCDIQLPRTDGKAGGINISIPKEAALYDRNAARAILQALRAQPRFSQILFNDQTLIDEGLCVKSDASHYHHIHLDIKPPARGEIEREPMRRYHSGGRLYQGSEQDDIDYQAHALQACDNSAPIPADEKYIEFGKMGTTSKRSNNKENVFLRWNNIPAKTCEMDIVVHFHGFNITGQNNFFDYVVRNSGLDLKDRTRPTLCILPFGKHEPKYKEWKDGEWIEKENKARYVFPFLETDGGLRELIDESLKALKNNFSVGRLILAVHSGGGRAVADILKRKVKGTLKLKKANNDIDEVHLFDATYGGTDDFIRWAEKRILFDSALDKSELETKGGGLRVLYLPTSTNRAGNCVDTGTKAGSEKIEPKLIDFTKQHQHLRRCYRVEPVNINHLDIPNVFGVQLLRKGFADLKVLPEHSSFINPCCKADPRCGIKQAAQQSLAFHSQEELDYAAELRIEDPRVAKEKLSEFRKIRCEANRQLRAEWEKVKQEMVRISTEEFQVVWDSGNKSETEAAMIPVIRRYWQDGVFPGGTIPSSLAIPAESWSAAFIAWVIKEAGGGDRFSRVHDEAKFRLKFRPRAHWRYVAPALINKTKLSPLNPFWAYAIDAVRPQVGDIVVQSRDGSGLTLNQLANLTGNASDGDVGWYSHGDIVVSVGTNEIRVIGGNVGGTVQETIARLNANGFVQSTGGANNDHLAIVRINTDQYVLPECA